MRTIFKTKLDVCDYQTIELPQDYKIIHVDMQQDAPCIWYECTPDMPLVKVEILCFGTGYRMPDPGTPDGAIEHIGSVVTRDGFYVWHYYRKAYKDECEHLFAKLKAMGFEWDAKKKDIVKIKED